MMEGATALTRTMLLNDRRTAAREVGCPVQCQRVQAISRPPFGVSTDTLIELGFPRHLPLVRSRESQGFRLSQVHWVCFPERP
jgi:hypothetical protein